MVHPNAGAIDIESTVHMAGVNPSGCDLLPRVFGTLADDLHACADWFADCGVTSVALESTDVYWIPAFEIVEARGFEAILVNVRCA